MAIESEIRKMLEQFIDKRTVRAIIVQGIVKAVDAAAATCDVEPIEKGAVFQDVKLQTLVGAEQFGLVLHPKIDSPVFILVINETEFFLLSCQHIETLQLNVNNKFSLDIDAEGNCVMDDGQFGGLIKIQELKTQIDKNTAMLKAMQGVISASVIPEPGLGLPSALQTALKGAVSALPLADLTNIENPKIKH